MSTYFKYTVQKYICSEIFFVLAVHVMILVKLPNMYL